MLRAEIQIIYLHKMCQILHILSRITLLHPLNTGRSVSLRPHSCKRLACETNIPYYIGLQPTTFIFSLFTFNLGSHILSRITLLHPLDTGRSVSLRPGTCKHLACETNIHDHISLQPTTLNFSLLTFDLGSHILPCIALLHLLQSIRCAFI